MKTVGTPELRSHLDQDVTGLATCWEIERVDGVIFRFTDADESVTIDGLDYDSVGAYKRTAIESSATLAVDNLEVIGLASELALSAQDLRNGLFDNARVSVFLCAWSAVVPGKIKLRRGFFGEVQTLPNDTFQVELRGLMQRMAHNYMDIFSATCLYDLGEPACGIILRPNRVTRSTLYALGDVVTAAQSAGELALRHDLTIGDYSFETLAATGLSNSSDWYDTGATPMVAIATGAFTGNGSLTGDGAAGTTTQVINIEENTTLDAALVAAGNAACEIYGYRKNIGGDTGRVQVSFLDEDGNPAMVGKSVRSSVRQRYTSPFSIAGDFTAMFWLNPDDLTEGGIMAGGSNASPGIGSEITYTSNIIKVTTLGVELQTTQPGATTSVEVGEWNHVAVTRIGAVTNIYVNFELQATTSGWATDFFFEDLFFSNDELSSGHLFNGALDDVRIYNVGKTYAEIVIEAKSDPVTPDANLLRWFSFDDDTINDQTGNDATSYAGAGTLTYETTKAPFNSTGVTVGYDSGSNDLGTSWTRFASGTLAIPRQARSIKIELSAAGTGQAFFDQLNGVMYDLTQSDPEYLPSDLNNVYWECTNDGTTDASYPATFAGGVGSTAVDGGVIWTARNAFLRSGVVLSATDRRVFTADITEPRAQDGWFQGGTVIFITGANAGVAMEAKKWTLTGGQLELFLSVPGVITPGDEFLIYPGCDKSRISCAAIFGNMPNFFGFPDVPGQDELFRYPDSK